MRRFDFARIMFITVCMAFRSLNVMAGNAGDPAMDDLNRKISAQVYQLADQMLAGKTVVLRIYTHPYEHPETFRRVSVRAPGRVLSMEAIRAASGDIPQNALIVVLGSDQSDEQVVAAMGRFVSACLYRVKGENLSLVPDYFRDPAREWWVFTDALGEPIPDASVEIALQDDMPRTMVILGKATLDANGRLRCLQGGSLHGKLLFTISHPRYGTAVVQRRNAPDEDSLPMLTAPLVPQDSPAMTGAIRGVVTDTQGNPVAGAEVGFYMNTGVLTDERLKAYTGARGTVITCEKGRFAAYCPLGDGQTLPDIFIPSGTVYNVRIEPPKSLHLRVYDGKIVAGSDVTITLSSMPADEFFHTFSFKTHAGPVTDLEEVGRIKLSLLRDGRSWTSLAYNQWKEGCALPLGTLMVAMDGQSPLFKPIVLGPDSPRHLVFEEIDPILYRGRVVDGATGEPVPDVLVLIGSFRDALDPRSIIPQDWQKLRALAAAETAVPFPDKIFYECDNRVTVTDPNGWYEVIFLRSASRRDPYSFTALHPGYPPIKAPTVYGRPDEEGVVQVATIRLAQPRDPEAAYVPTLVFEDENGPVNDPNKLKSIRLNVEAGWNRRDMRLDEFPKQKQFMPGIYRATGAWDDKYYVFEPVDLSEARPETVVFKPKEVPRDTLIFQGRAVHGVTGRPIPKAVVIHTAMPDPPCDISGLTTEQWTAIQSLGPDPEPTDPALAPLKQILAARPGAGASRVAVADTQGRFQIGLGRKESSSGGLAIVARDFLGAGHWLNVELPGADYRPGSGLRQTVPPGKNGVVTLPPAGLFPAGTVILEPVTGEPGYSMGRKPRLELRIVTVENDPTPGSADPRTSSETGILRYRELRPNARQSLYVPADVTMRLLLYEKVESPWAPIAIPSVRLRQGEVLDAGRLELNPGVAITVEVTDPTGKPLRGQRLHCMDEQWGSFGTTTASNAEGVVRAHVMPFSKGRLSLFGYDPSTQTRLEQSVSYDVANSEEGEPELVLRISGSFMELLRKAGEERLKPRPEPMFAPPPPAPRR